MVRALEFQVNRWIEGSPSLNSTAGVAKEQLLGICFEDAIAAENTKQSTRL